MHWRAQFKSSNIIFFSFQVAKQKSVLSDQGDNRIHKLNADVHNLENRAHTVLHYGVVQSLANYLRCKKKKEIKPESNKTENKNNDKTIDMLKPTSSLNSTFVCLYALLLSRFLRMSDQNHRAVSTDRSVGESGRLPIFVTRGIEGNNSNAIKIVD